MPKHVKILSIDGGGVRGVIPARFLVEIEQKAGKPICDLFDFVAGTSSGGILALAMTKPDAHGKPAFTATALLQIFEEFSRVVFKPSLWRQIITLWSFLEEKYPSDNLEALLNHYFGNTTLDEACKPVLVTGYEIERRSAFFFKSNKAKAQVDRNFLMRDAARATSAAPTYFEPALIETRDASKYYSLIDGGVFANNPTMCAFAEAKKMFPEATEYTVVSLGTGSLTEPLHYHRAKGWGKASWARPILNVIFDGVQDTVDYQMRTFLPISQEHGREYFRFQITLPPQHNALDDTHPENLRTLQLLAEDEISQRQQELDELIARLTR